MKETTPSNDSLNASRLRWGLPLPMVIAILVFSGLIAWWYSAVLAAVLVFGIPFASSRLVTIDRNIYRLGVLSLHQKAHYYPGRSRG